MRVINVIRVRDGLPVDIYNYINDMDGAVSMFSILTADSGLHLNGLELEAAIDNGYIMTADGCVCFNADSSPHMKEVQNGKS